jgi:tetratricopeptide (TPR) repeat protein
MTVRKTVARLAFALVATCSTLHHRAEATERVLTNEDVVNMATAGVGDENIMAKIQGATQVGFQLSADHLIALRKAGISAPVIHALLERSKRVTFLQSLQPKDQLTLLVSIGAIVLSFFSFRQKKSDMKLGDRKQLTDLLLKITDLNTERAKYDLKKTDYPKNYRGLMSDQRRFLARQAEVVMSRISAQVTPFEYQLVADSFAYLGYLYEAERLFERAVSVSVTPFDRGIAIRRYAVYLFDIAEPAEGRKRFGAALGCFEGESEVARDSRVDTYLRWSNLENGDDARDLLTKASAEAEAIRLPARRQRWADQIRQRLNELSAAADQRPPGVQPHSSGEANPPEQRRPSSRRGDAMTSRCLPPPEFI